MSITIKTTLGELDEEGLRAAVFSTPTSLFVGIGEGFSQRTFLERVHPGRRQHPGLSHAPADHLAPAPGAFDVLRGAHEHRADGRAEALAEADRDGVEGAADPRGDGVVAAW